jgi:hypothetical protein
VHREQLPGLGRKDRVSRARRVQPGAHGRPRPRPAERRDSRTSCLASRSIRSSRR